MPRDLGTPLVIIALLAVFIVAVAIAIKKLSEIGERDRSSDRYNRYFFREITHAQISALVAEKEHNIPQLRIQLARVRALGFELPTTEIRKPEKLPKPPPPASRPLRGDTVRPAHPSPSRRG